MKTLHKQIVCIHEDGHEEVIQSIPMGEINHDPVIEPTPEPLPEPAPEPIPEPVPQPTSGFFDSFTYSVLRDADWQTKVDIFQSNGWSGVRDSTERAPRNGYIYTTDSIPNGDAARPTDNQNMLALEYMPPSNGEQSDIHIDVGNIPADAWIQFWVYQYLPEGNQLDERKLIYPMKHNAQGERFSNWLFCLSPWDSGAPLYLHNWNNETNSESPGFDLYPHDGAFRMRHGDDHNVGGNGYTLPNNRWQLVKLHYKTDALPYVWQMYVKDIGGEWVEVLNWNTDNSDFDWLIPPEDAGGHEWLELGSVYGSHRIVRDQPISFDHILFIQDFYMGNEAGLQVYQ